MLNIVVVDDAARCCIIGAVTFAGGGVAVTSKRRGLVSCRDLRNCAAKPLDAGLPPTPADGPLPPYGTCTAATLLDATFFAPLRKLLAALGAGFAVEGRVPVVADIRGSRWCGCTVLNCTAIPSLS